MDENIGKLNNDFASEIKLAFEILSDNEKRKEYDLFLYSMRPIKSANKQKSHIWDEMDKQNKE